MRFTPYIKATPRSVNRRRLSSAERALAQERAKWGMFADQMASKETAEERIARLDAGVVEWIQEMRDRHAASWRRGRRALDSLPSEQRRALLKEWNEMQWLPGSPDYFLDFLHRKGVKVESEGGES